MTLFPSSQDRDTELLSAYLDNQLSAAERAKLERRLETDSELRAALDGLRYVKTSLASLPKVKPPRNFILTPQRVGQKGRTQSRVSSLIPVLNWATAVAAVLFAVLIATDLSGGRRLTSAQPVAAPEVAVVQEAPSAAAEMDAANAAEKSLTPTPEGALSLMAPAAVPSGEPLTGSGGEGGGGGEPAGPVPPSGEPLIGGAGMGDGGAGGAGETPGTPEVSAYAADSLTVTPPSDESLRSLATVASTAEQPAPETPTPTVAPTEAEPQTPTPTPIQTQTLIPLRLAQLVAAVALIALVTASFLLRRK
ncbi:MAG TPA: hypothetical protein VJL59_20025 [Anaerolineales bacterium]|nr:hypothetical protein [Anaerolineales bacterium]